MWNREHEIQPGQRPGLIHEQASRVRVIWCLYEEGGLQQGELSSLDQEWPNPQEGQTLWLDIIGVPGRDGLARLQEKCGLHALALEDVQHGGQNPKTDNFHDHLYAVFQLPLLEGEQVEFSQLNLFWMSNVVISIHDQADLLEPVRQRLGLGKGVIRGGGSEYLLYALSDLAVDYGFPCQQYFTDQLYELEGRIEVVQHDLSHEIYSVRRQLSVLQRQAMRQRLLLRDLTDADHPLLSQSHALYWRDCLDHAERLYEGVTYLRESAADLLNTHLALLSHRMNDVMKVLTVMSTIFIPLSFLVGLYGMNFDTESPYNLPELGWRYGYVFVWGVMLCVVSGLLWFFRKKKWF